MKLLVILSLTSLLALTSSARLVAVKRRRESKWDIIHHEYHGPPAPLSKDGRVIDTPEVALAKANHLAIHAETAAELARLMAEANALDADWSSKKEEPKAQGAAAAAAAAAEEQAKPEEPAAVSEAQQPEVAPIVAAPVEMTPELMAMLTAAAAAEEQQAQQEQQQQQQQAEEAPAAAAAPAAEEAAPAAEPAAEAAPAAEPEAAAAPEAEAPAQPAEEAAPAPAAEEAAPAAEPAAEAAPVQEEPAAEEAPKQEEAKPEEAKKEEESKPVTENEANNEVDAERPVTIMQKSYEGPLAPLSEDGRVVDTIEVRKAKEAHLIAYEQAVKLAKMKRESGESGPAWYEMRKKLFVPPVYLLYHHDGPIGYKGPKAPLSEDGRVVDTEEVERAKTVHRKAYEQAEALAKRHPPKPEDNSV